MVPSWLETPDQAKVPIYIDPGMAFGTGTHATTQIAAELASNLIKSERVRSVLDVGTGTGILAFMCEKLGAERVHATEIDAEARRVARENIVQNQLSKTEVLEVQVQDLKEKYDLVIANIIDGVLVQIKPDLLRCFSGCLIVTGILKERENSFLEDFLQDAPFCVAERKERDEWVGFLLRRRQTENTKL